MLIHTNLYVLKGGTGDKLDVGFAVCYVGRYRLLQLGMPQPYVMGCVSHHGKLRTTGSTRENDDNSGGCVCGQRPRILAPCSKRRKESAVSKSADLSPASQRAIIQ